MLGALGAALVVGREGVLGHPGQIPLDGLVLDASIIALLVAAPLVTPLILSVASNVIDYALPTGEDAKAG